MLEVLEAYALQSGVGTAAPIHEMRTSPSVRPVATDGAASRVGSMRFRNCPMPPRTILPLPSCHVKPSLGLSATVAGALSLRIPSVDASVGFACGALVNALPSRRTP